MGSLSDKVIRGHPGNLQISNTCGKPCNGAHIRIHLIILKALARFDLLTEPRRERTGQSRDTPYFCARPKIT